MLSDDTQRVIDALASPVRREILWLLWDRELAAGEIVDAFHLTAPTISSHLRVLRTAGLVGMRSEGTFRRYRADKTAVERLRPLLHDDSRKWFPGSTPAPLAVARTTAVVIVETDAPCTQADAFRAFTDPLLYSRWAGVPVSLVDGQFVATMEWGLEVRGRYDYVVEPSLIVMSWDFDRATVPLPGAAQRAYLEFTSVRRRCHVVLQQLVEDDAQARYMQRAWGVMLGRFRDAVRDALDPRAQMPPRPRRTASDAGG